jgi:hypothetical protein
MVMMVVGADDDNGLTIVTVVLYVDVVRPSSCTNGKIKTGQTELGQTETSLPNINFSEVLRILVKFCETSLWKLTISEVLRNFTKNIEVSRHIK